MQIKWILFVFLVELFSFFKFPLYICHFFMNNTWNKYLNHLCLFCFELLSYLIVSNGYSFLKSILYFYIFITFFHSLILWFLQQATCGPAGFCTMLGWNWIKNLFQKFWTLFQRFCLWNLVKLSSNSFPKVLNSFGSEPFSKGPGFVLEPFPKGFPLAKLVSSRLAPCEGLPYIHFSVGCPFPKAPTCFKIAGALFQMLEVHMQHLPVGTPFLAKFFPEISGLWLCQCFLFQRSPKLINHLAVPIWAPSTRHFHNQLQLSTFFCGACQVSPRILLAHCFLYFEPRLSLLLFQRGFCMVLLFFLACFFVGLCFLYLFQSRCWPFHCLFQSRCWPFQWFFSHTPRQLANHPFPKIPFAQAFFWQCTLQQRKCLFCLVCLLGCLQTPLGNHCYPWKHHCFLFSAFSLILLLLFPFRKEVPLV